MDPETTDFTEFENPLFAYYAAPDFDLIFLTLVDSAAESSQAVTEVQGYFGRDGRFIPICSADAEELQPCILEENVVYDSGLSATVSLFFRTGMYIILFAIASRLFFGSIVWGFSRYSTWREDRKARANPPTGTEAAGVPAA